MSKTTKLRKPTAKQIAKAVKPLQFERGDVVEIHYVDLPKRGRRSRCFGIWIKKDGPMCSQVFLLSSLKTVMENNDILSPTGRAVNDEGYEVPGTECLHPIDDHDSVTICNACHEIL